MAQSQVVTKSVRTHNKKHGKRHKAHHKRVIKRIGVLQAQAKAVGAKGLFSWLGKLTKEMRLAILTAAAPPEIY